MLHGRFYHRHKLHFVFWFYPKEMEEGWVGFQCSSIQIELHASGQVDLQVSVMLATVFV